MELWFIYALASALFAGLYSVSQKIAVERGHQSITINTLNTVVSSVLAFIVFGATFTEVPPLLLIITIAGISGIANIIASIIRMDALKYVDTALFFPLYKTFGPIFTLFLGILFFSEWFTKAELLGMAIGVVVPLMLIHKSENTRQNNLKKGLLFVLISALFAALSATLGKMGAEAYSNIFLFVGISHAFGALSGLLIQKIKNKKTVIKNEENKKSLYTLGVIGGVLQFLTFSAFMMAFQEGSLAIVYTVNSFYILIPIIFSIIVYKEHWNARKAFAIGLSIVALAFLR